MSASTEREAAEAKPAVAPSKPKLGFIGLGKMGLAMAQRLIANGFPLVVYDVDPIAIQQAVARGAVPAASPAAVAAQASRTICMTATTAQAESVIIGPTGIAQGAQSNTIVLCMSTIDPGAVRRLSSTLAESLIRMLDAPVSGGTAKAGSGELSIMVGGDALAFEECGDIFAVLASNVFHIGGPGEGQAMKLINNMLIQVNLIAVCEALVLAAKAGLDLQKVYDVVRVSTGNSFVFETRVPRILAGDFVPGGSVDICYKDQELQTAFAKHLGMPLLMANVSQQVYQMARAAGLGGEDAGAVIKVLAGLSQVDLPIAK